MGNADSSILGFGTKVPDAGVRLCTQNVASRPRRITTRCTRSRGPRGFDIGNRSPRPGERCRSRKDVVTTLKTKCTRDVTVRGIHITRCDRDLESCDPSRFESTVRVMARRTFPGQSGLIVDSILPNSMQPTFLFICELESQPLDAPSILQEAPRTSLLICCWFLNEFPEQPLTLIENKIATIDWQSHATDSPY